MRAVLGIGNPGTKYLNTRHNIGFMIIDAFAKKHSIELSPSKGDYYLGSSVSASPFVLIKPTTFVNLTGIAALQAIQKYEISTKDLLVISDDVNLPVGKLRIRSSGGDGGHNGIASVIYHLNTDQFPRLRFGIGNRFETGMMADYVLTKFSDEEFYIISNSLDLSVGLIENFVEAGIESMLAFYSKQTNKLNNFSILEDDEGT